MTSPVRAFTLSSVDKCAEPIAEHRRCRLTRNQRGYCMSNFSRLHRVMPAGGLCVLPDRICYLTLGAAT